MQRTTGKPIFLSYSMIPINQSTSKVASSYLHKVDLSFVPCKSFLIQYFYELLTEVFRTFFRGSIVVNSDSQQTEISNRRGNELNQRSRIWLRWRETVADKMKKKCCFEAFETIELRRTTCSKNSRGSRSTKVADVMKPYIIKVIWTSIDPYTSVSFLSPSVRCLIFLQFRFFHRWFNIAWNYGIIACARNALKKLDERLWTLLNITTMYAWHLMTIRWA